MAELLTTVAILSIMISAAFAFLIEGTETFKFSDKQVDVQRTARIALTRITKDYRGCYGVIEIADYRVELQGISVSGTQLERLSDTQFQPTEVSHRDWQIDQVDLDPAVYVDGEPITNYTVTHDQGLVTFTTNPGANATVTADYTYDATVTYQVLNSDDADLVRTVDWTDQSGQLQQEQQTLASHIRNRHPDYIRPAFTRQSARRIKVDLVAAEELENYPSPRPYQVETEIVRHSGSWEAVGLWYFERGSNHTIAYDSSPYQNDGTIECPTDPWTNRSTTGSYSLDFAEARQCRVFVPDDDSLDVEQLTIETWVLPADPQWVSSVAQRYIARKQGAYDFYVNTDDDRLYSTVETSEGTRSFSAPLSLVTPADNWVYLATSYDGRRISICLNDEVRTSAAFDPPADIVATNDDLWLGWGIRSMAERRWVFDGWIDEIRLYNGAKSSSALRLPQE